MIGRKLQNEHSHSVYDLKYHTVFYTKYRYREVAARVYLSEEKMLGTTYVVQRIYRRIENASFQARLETIG